MSRVVAIATLGNLIAVFLTFGPESKQRGYSLAAASINAVF